MKHRGTNELSVALALAMLSCTRPNPIYCGDLVCDDPAFPYCDRDGFIAGAQNTCIAVSCPESGDFVSCNADNVISCNMTRDGYEVTACEMGCNEAGQGCNQCSPNSSFCTASGVQQCAADGTPSSVEPCAAGCVASPTPHCAYISPRYLPDVCDVPAVDDALMSSSVTMSTDIDSLCTGGIVAQSGAPDICVVRGKRIVIDAGVTLQVIGSRAIAFVADESLDLDGILDVSADSTASGPGGGTVSSGGNRTLGSGGGGAGFKTTGAPGGNSSQDGGAANGGSASTNPALLAVLIGGSRNSGGGGGAAVLVACRGSVSVSGLIDAGGGGGIAGDQPVDLARAAGGAGAGGNIILQGLQVSVIGQLYANGGGGGAGYTGTATGNTGQNGSRSTSPAPGGFAVGAGGGGGSGGAAFMAPAVGRASTTNGTAGGGGASVGFFQTYTPQNVEPTLSPLGLSPLFEPNLHIETR